MQNRLNACFSVLVVSQVFASDLTERSPAKFAAMISAHAGFPTTIDCPNEQMAADLLKFGMKNDSSSKVAWASTQHELEQFSKSNKFIICANREWLSAGASVAIIERGGRLSLEINFSNLRKSGLTLGHIIQADPIPPKPIG